MVQRLLDLADLLAYRWEVLVGDRVLSREEFTSLVSVGRPIARWGKDWVLLDPAELRHLPSEMNEEGRMKAPEALRADAEVVEQLAEGERFSVVARIRLSDW